MVKKKSRKQVVNQGIADQLETPVGRLVAGVQKEEREQSGESKRRVSPYEKRRRNLKLTVTFSDAAIADRLRAVTERWNLYSVNGRPKVSAVIEYLLLPQLEAAELGKIPPLEEQ